MTNLKNIVRGTWFLLVNILLTGYGLLKKITLPSLNRKGNVLGSVFLWFIDIVERIIAFEKEIFHSSWLIRNRFVKQGLMIATVFLFLLSSIEWPSINEYSQKTEQEKNTAIEKREENTFHLSVTKQIPIATRVREIIHHYPSESLHEIYATFSPPALKKFLVFCVIRV